MLISKKKLEALKILVFGKTTIFARKFLNMKNKPKKSIIIILKQIKFCCNIPKQNIKIKNK